MEPYERGRAAWPAVQLDREVFADHVRRLGAGDAHAEDLYLACACARGDASALALFEERFVAEVPRYIAHIDSSPAVADETRQLLREYLLVAADGARPRIADYRGGGPLTAWLRVAATRVVLQMKRKSKRVIASDDEVAERLAAVEPDVEVALLRKRYAVELAAALKAAIAALPERDRALLKMSIIDGLGIDELCRLYGVHRATVARWVVRLKQHIFDEAVALMRRRLLLDAGDVQSLCRAIGSQLDFSLGGLVEP
jgi:RNA polymerase sigma-70 factor (ECF subfamily)